MRAKLKLAGTEELARLEQELQNSVRTIRELGLKPDDSPVIRQQRERLAEMKQDANVRKDTATEADVYNHLANFFARYYAEGDFISQRRYSSGGRAAT